MHSRSISPAVLSLATLSLVGLAACGDDDTSSAATPPAATTATTTIAATTTTGAEALPGAVIMYTGAFDSPYCVTARDWVAHELQEFEPSDDPAVNRAYFVEYRAFIDKAAAQAPADIAADWTLFNAAQVKFEAILEHYNYDGARIEAEATDEEKAYLDAPPPAEQQAQENFHRFEAEVCHAGELLPAEVTYTGDPNSELCNLAEDPSNVTPPSELEEYFASGAASRLADDRIAAAPPEIKSDVEIEEGWKVEQTPLLLAAHGWDFARVLREGTEEELIAMTYAAPEVRDANARLGAYYAQVCEQ